WPAHQLIRLAKDGAPMFDSIIVVTDRKILDQQIKDTIRQFAQVGATVGHAEHSGDLRKFIAEGKRIIISTVQKFPFILDEIGSDHRGRRFAIVIDEAHSSQGGRASAALSMALSTAGAEEDDEKLEKKIEDDPEFDTKRAKKKLRRYVESHDLAFRLKAEIMIDHFHEQVLALNKIGGEARAMVVTSGIERAIQYFHVIRDYLGERKSRYRAIVAFSSEHEYGGATVTEASLNGFPSSQIADKIQEAPYRFLICADKFQPGYDERLLHTMYVDK